MNICYIIFFHKQNSKFILSTWYKNNYRENIFIKNLWSNFNLHTIKHFYHIGGKEINRNYMIEALITNYITNIKCDVLINTEQQLLF